MTIDFDQTTKNQLVTIFRDDENIIMPIVDDNYSIKINLKDESIYAFRPRRFA